MPLEEVGLQAVIKGVSQFIADGKSVNQAMDNMGKEAKDAAGETDKTSTSLDKVGKTAQQNAPKLQTMADKMAGVGKAGQAMSIGVTLPLIGIGGAALAMSTKFNASMANIATLIPGNVGRVNELKGAVQDMGIAVGKTTEDLAGGLYQVISAFGDTSDTVKILDINARAGAAGLATTLDAINLTSAVTKGYGDASAEAVQKVSDLAFQTVKLGQTTFPELAGSIGLVTPLAAALGVTQTELFATMATGTGVTGSATQVATQFRGVLQSLMAPTVDMTKLIDNLGYASGEAMLQDLGLQGAIDTVVKAAKDANIPLQKYIGSIEGQTLALALSGPQAGAFTDKLKAMANVTGMTDEAFKEQTQGINANGFAMQQARIKLEVMAQKLGDGLAPALTKAMDAAAPLLDGLVKLADTFSKMDPTSQTAIVAVLATAAAMGPLLLVTSKTYDAFTNVAGAAKAMGGVIGTTFDKLKGEGGKLDDLAKSADGAATGKDGVTTANKKLEDSAKLTTKAIGGEAGMLDKLRDAWVKMSSSMPDIKLSVSGQAGGGAIEGLGKVLGSTIAGAIGVAIGSIGVGSILGGIGTALAAVGTGIVAVISSPVAIVGLLIAGVLAQAILAGFWLQWEWGRWTEGWSAAQDVMAGIGDQLGKWLSDGLQAAGEILKPVQAVFDFLTGLAAQEGWKLPFFLLGMAIGVVIVAGEKLFDWFHSLVMPPLPDVGKAFTDMAKSIGDALGTAKDFVVTKLGEAWTWISTVIPTWPGMVRNFVAPLPGMLGNLFNDAKDFVIARLTDAWNWISTNVPSWPGLVGGFLATLPGIVGDAFNAAKDFVLSTMGAAWDWITANVPTWPDAILGFLSTLPGLVSGVFDSAKNFAIEKVTDLWDWISAEVPRWAGEIGGFLSSLPETVRGIFDDMRLRAEEVAKTLIRQAGVWGAEVRDGIVDALREIIKKVEEIFNAIADAVRRGIQAVRDVLGESSPSKVFADIGLNIGLGLAQGIQSSIPVVQAAWDDLNAIMEARDPDFIRMFENFSTEAGRYSSGYGSAISAFRGLIDHLVGALNTGVLQGAANAAGNLADSLKEFSDPELEAWGIGAAIPISMANLKAITDAGDMLSKMAGKSAIVDQIKDLIGGFDELGMALPPDLVTAIKAAGAALGGPFADAIAKLLEISPAQAALKQVQHWLDDVQLGQNLAAAVAAMASVGAAIPKDLLNLLKDMPRDVGGFLDTVINNILKAAGMLASGTANWRGGLAMVGERGPELVNLPQGSRVFSASETMQMMRSIPIVVSPGLAAAQAGRGGSNSYNYNYSPTINSAGGDSEPLSYSHMRSWSSR